MGRSLKILRFLLKYDFGGAFRSLYFNTWRQPILSSESSQLALTYFQVISDGLAFPSFFVRFSYPSPFRSPGWERLGNCLH